MHFSNIPHELVRITKSAHVLLKSSSFWSLRYQVLDWESYVNTQKNKRRKIVSRCIKRRLKDGCMDFENIAKIIQPKFFLNKIFKLQNVLLKRFFFVGIVRFNLSELNDSECIEVTVSRTQCDPNESISVTKSISGGTTCICLLDKLSVSLLEGGLLKIVWTDTQLVAAIVFAVPLMAITKNLIANKNEVSRDSLKITIDLQLTIMVDNILVDLFYERFCTSFENLTEIIPEDYKFAYKLNMDHVLNNILNIESSVTGTAWRATFPIVLVTLRLCDTDMHPILWVCDWCLIQENNNTNIMSDKNQIIQLTMPNYSASISLATLDDKICINSFVLRI